MIASSQKEKETRIFYLTIIVIVIGGGFLLHLFSQLNINTSYQSDKQPNVSDTYTLPSPFASSKRGIYFAHFSKSGGTTFKMILKHYLSNLHQVEWCANKKHGRNENPQAGEICSSHERGEDGTETDHSRVIMVRHPIDRLLSEYAWFYKYKGHRGAPQGRSDPFFEFYSLSPQEQSKILTQLAQDLKNQLKHGTSERLCRFLGFPKILLSEQRQCTQADFDGAKQKLLTEYDLVLITEKFDESVVLFTHFFQLDNVTSIDQLGYTKHKVVRSKVHRQDLPPNTLADLEELLAFDIRLYELAKEKFQQQFEQMATQDYPYFQQHVDQYSARQKKVAHLCKQDSTATFDTCLF